MSLRARVGRHTRTGGRHCQNWADDQKVVIGLLNHIPVVEGGTGGSLSGHIVSGICSDALYRAISQFEDKYFPGQRNGFLDPGGSMLKRMEQLAGPQVIVESIVALSRLDMLRNNVLDETSMKGKWTAGERVALDPLVKLAIKHIDNLKSMGLARLPWPVEIFGRAYTTKNTPSASIGTHGKGLLSPFRDARLRFYDTNDDGVFETPDDPPPLPEMRFGKPVDLNSYITTAKLPALLLFDAGTCLRVRPYHTGSIYYAKESIKFGSLGYKNDLGLKPIDGAKENGFIN